MAAGPVTSAPPALDVVIGVLALLCGGVAVWSAAGMDPTDLGDGGLAPALPPVFWVAVVGLNLAFVLSLGRRVPAWLSPALVTGLLLLLYGPASVLGAAPRIAVSWRHLGVADAMANGVFDPRIDVYFNWPDSSGSGHVHRGHRPAALAGGGVGAGGERRPLVARGRRRAPGVSPGTRTPSSSRCGCS